MTTVLVIAACAAYVLVASMVGQLLARYADDDPGCVIPGGMFWPITVLVVAGIKVARACIVWVDAPREQQKQQGSGPYRRRE